VRLRLERELIALCDKHGCDVKPDALRDRLKISPREGGRCGYVTEREVADEHATPWSLFLLSQIRARL
jgi:hypothetical protein